MRSLELLGELRRQMAPRVSAERFDGLLIAARIWHRDHRDEDDETHRAHLMQIFIDAGIPALETVPIVDFVLNEQPAPR
jgi:hypothetical protein